MISSGVSLNEICFNSVIKCLSKTGDWRSAYELLCDGVSRDVQISKEAYTSVIDSCIASDQVTLATQLMDEMRTNGHEPDLGGVVVSCGKEGKWEDALAFLDEITGKGSRPDLTTYGAAFDACSRAGQWEHALRLLTDIAKESNNKVRQNSNEIRENKIGEKDEADIDEIENKLSSANTCLEGDFL